MCILAACVLQQLKDRHSYVLAEPSSVLGLMQAEHLLTSSAGRRVLNGLGLLPISHDLRGDAALFRQLGSFIFRGTRQRGKVCGKGGRRCS